MFVPVTESSMLGRACEKGILDIRLTDIRDYTLDKHNRTDEYPFGGGTGMVLQAEPVFRAMEKVTGIKTSEWGKDGKKKCIYMSPRGRILDREKIEELSREEELVILCGHYEGVDQRILDHFDMEKVDEDTMVLDMVNIEFCPGQEEGTDIHALNQNCISIGKIRNFVL